MKKVFCFASACVLVALMASCSSPVSDAKKTCSKAEKCAALKDDQEKFQKCQEEFAKFLEEIDQKYDDDAIDEKTQEQVSEILDGCGDAFVTTVFG